MEEAGLLLHPACFALSALSASIPAPALRAVGAAEDPEKILDQAVEDMQADLIRLRQAAAEVGRAAVLQAHAGAPGGGHGVLKHVWARLC